MEMDHDRNEFGWGPIFDHYWRKILGLEHIVSVDGHARSPWLLDFFKTEQSRHQLTLCLLLFVCGTTYDGTLQSKTSTTVHTWTHRDDWNWSFPTFPEPFVEDSAIILMGQSTEGNIEEELDIDGSISFPHEKGDWTWWFTCVITAVSVKCFFWNSKISVPQSIQNKMMRLNQLYLFFEFALLMTQPVRKHSDPFSQGMPQTWRIQ